MKRKYSKKEKTYGLAILVFFAPDFAWSILTATVIYPYFSGQDFNVPFFVCKTIAIITMILMIWSYYMKEEVKDEE